MIRVVKKIAIKYDIIDENQLEVSLSELIDTLDNGSIKELSLSETTRQFSALLNQNRIILPDYIYLLVKGIVLLEGIGCEISPDINIIDSIKPYGVKLVKKKLSPEYLVKKGLGKMYDLGDKIEEFPEDIHSLIQKINNGELKITHNINGLNDIKNTINRLVIALIISSMAIASSILVLADLPPKIWGVPILGLLGFLGAGFLSTIVILQIIRNKKID